MKHDQLHSIAHNYAASLASGLGFVVGHYPTDVFKDAAANGTEGIVVDFLTGQVFAENCSDELRRGVPIYRDSFQRFCQKHGADKLDFSMCRVRFVSGWIYNFFIVTIRDRAGKCSSREYGGWSGQRVKQKDSLGRFRPKLLSTPDAETLKFAGSDVPDSRKAKKESSGIFGWNWFKTRRR